MRDKNWRPIAITSLVVLGLYIGGSIVYDKFETMEAQGTAQDLAEPVDDLCTTDAKARAQIGTEKCDKAAEVQAEPDVPVVIQGTDGKDGRGIRGTRIDDSNLIISYTDGAEENVGVVVGESGIDGANGLDGRGIASTEIVEGQLQVNYTDGNSELLGTVVGSNGIDGENGIDGSNGVDGRGIANTQAVEGRLIVNYTDGTSEDVGPLPQGPSGPAGLNGEPPISWTYRDALGGEHTCTRTEPFDPAAPTYQCD